MSENSTFSPPTPREDAPFGYFGGADQELGNFIEGTDLVDACAPAAAMLLAEIDGVPQFASAVAYTPEQYAALIKLTATLCKIFPKLKCDYPKDADGKLIPHKLPDDQLNNYEGVLGHYHVQTNKDDPGPALNWEKLIGGAQALLGQTTTRTNVLLSPRQRDLQRH